MRLTQIEIKGFKSFADKTIIQFNRNMTGIVGPNGCGKSNTIDAIRWVLGEQKSRALRLDKMDNILFNGTRKRTPAGRAEVSLTFENTRNLLPTEFATVTISRLLYRSGESEYLLNGVRCRLKDISNLFMDTGISSDSYAIIELKMIDEILNDNEDSRRRLFEQAAGISKYKVRKKETLQKLTATDEDLSRVEDLLFEIENNLKTLEKQAKKTEKYHKLRQQYKELSIEMAIHQLGKYKIQFEQLNQQLNNETDRKTHTNTLLAQTEAILEQLKNDVLAQEQHLSTVQKDLNKHLASLRDAEGQKNLLTQNARFLTEKIDKLNTQINHAKTTIEQLQKEIDHLNWDKKGEEEIVKNAENQLSTLQKASENSKQLHRNARQDLDKQQGELKNIEIKIFDIEKKIAVRISQRDGLLREAKDAQLRLLSQQTETESYQETIANAEKEQQNAEKVLAECSKRETELREQINNAEIQADNARQHTADIQRQADAKRNEHKLTKSLVDSLEGFADSIKFLKTQQHRWNTSNAPLLLDIVNCPDEYKTAIENYLQAQLNSYVIEHFNQAQTALDLLKKEQKGKASFLIIPNEQTADQDLNARDPNTQELIPNAKPAAALIELNKEQYRPLLNQLLKNVYLIDDDNFVPTDEWLQKGYIFAYKNGSLVRSKSHLSGGSVGSFEGKRIGKRQQLELLEKQLQQLERETAQAQKTSAEKREEVLQLQNKLKTAMQQTQQQRVELQKCQNKQAQLKIRLENAEKFVRESHHRQGNLNTQIAQADNDMVELNAQMAQIKTTRHEQAQQLNIAEQQFKSASNALNQATQAFNEQNITFHKQQNRLHNITQQLQFKNQQLNDTQRRNTEDQTAYNNALQQLETTQQQQAQTNNTLIALYADKELKEKKLADVETVYYKTRGEVVETEKQAKAHSKAKEQIDLLLQNIQAQIQQIKMQLLSIKERLNVEFKTDIDNLLEQEPSTQWTREELEARLAKTKNQLDNFGEINPLAIEAFNEIKQRYDFIIVQREDLLQAKKALLQTIGEIELTATQKFMTAFDKVRENFVTVFRSLFTDEDHCDLVLTEPNKPLESPIDIIAKPKGKRPQSINQLSGGEKSLTALAMVFALYLLKPAPFCILDEVDAPLDDANVGKFTQIIRRFSAESQFIIVTHNKNTMASVDAIYGVTMHEEGVSRVVPVDFSQLN